VECWRPWGRSLRAADPLCTMRGSGLASHRIAPRGALSCLSGTTSPLSSTCFLFFPVARDQPRQCVIFDGATAPSRPASFSPPTIPTSRRGRPCSPRPSRADLLAPPPIALLAAGRPEVVEIFVAGTCERRGAGQKHPGRRGDLAVYDVPGYSRRPRLWSAGPRSIPVRRQDDPTCPITSPTPA